MVDGRFAEVEGSERKLPAQLVLLAMGFTGPERGGLVEQLGVELDGRGNIVRDRSYMSSVPGVFVAGDAGRGQSLIVWALAEGRADAAGGGADANGDAVRGRSRIVWALAEGRAAAAGVDAYLTGSTTLPAPIPPTARPLTV